ncbi:hypothetical protein SLA2020_281500 [Shorea laevis]
MDRYSGMMNPSRSSRAGLAPPRPILFPLKVAYLTNFPTHDFLFCGLLWSAFIWSLRYAFTACNPCSTHVHGRRSEWVPFDAELLELLEASHGVRQGFYPIVADIQFNEVD